MELAGEITNWQWSKTGAVEGLLRHSGPFLDQTNHILFNSRPAHLQG